MLMNREQNTGSGGHIKTSNKYFENMARFRHWEDTNTLDAN